MRKKYLFPFEKEKKQYPWKEFLSLVGAGYLCIVILCIVILKTSDEESKYATTTFYQSRPDLIVVPTGDYGRIPKAMNFAEKYSLSNIFISGVYRKNSVDMILPKSDFSQIDLNQFEIDYWARNTIENAISTLKHLSEKGEARRILVVSSDYHIKRLKMIFDHLQEDVVNKYEFYYFGVPNNYSNMDNIIKLHKESIKFIRGWIIMKLWSPEKHNQQAIEKN